MLYTRHSEWHCARDEAEEHHCHGKYIDCRPIVWRLLDHLRCLKVQLPKLRAVVARTDATFNGGSATR